MGVSPEAKLLFVSDRQEDLSTVKSGLRKFFMVTEIALTEEMLGDYSDYPVMVICMNLREPSKVSLFRRFCRSAKCNDNARIFLVPRGSHLEVFQAANLGGRATITLPVDMAKLHAAVCHSSKSMQHLLHAKPNANLETAQNASKALVSMTSAVLEGRKISKAVVIRNAREICQSVNADNVLQWLDAVNNHHSYTYRHSLHVAGLAVAFADHLKFSEGDKIRIALGALMHDIGKAKIPLRILDKPGRLTSEEFAVARSHAIHGNQILANDGDWDPLTCNLVFQHHEFLDGSGYPSGLRGAEIIDPVRMLTIVDIFSALVDKRAYKDAMPAERAMGILHSMTNRLDMALVRAFDPVGARIMTQMKKGGSAA